MELSLEQLLDVCRSVLAAVEDVLAAQDATLVAVDRAVAELLEVVALMHQLRVLCASIDSTTASLLVGQGDIIAKFTELLDSQKEIKRLVESCEASLIQIKPKVGTLVDQGAVAADQTKLVVADIAKLVQQGIDDMTQLKLTVKALGESNTTLDAILKAIGQIGPGPDLHKIQLTLDAIAASTADSAVASDGILAAQADILVAADATSVACVAGAASSAGVMANTAAMKASLTDLPTTQHSINQSAVSIAGSCATSAGLLSTTVDLLRKIEQHSSVIETQVLTMDERLKRIDETSSNTNLFVKKIWEQGGGSKPPLAELVAIQKDVQAYVHSINTYQKDIWSGMGVVQKTQSTLVTYVTDPEGIYDSCRKTADRMKVLLDSYVGGAYGMHDNQLKLRTLVQSWDKILDGPYGNVCKVNPIHPVPALVGGQSTSNSGGSLTTEGGDSGGSLS